MNIPYPENTSSSPELAMAVSILINDLKLRGVFDVLDRGAITGVLEFNLDFLEAQPSERALRVFKSTMRENGFTVLEATWKEFLYVRVQCQVL